MLEIEGFFKVGISEKERDFRKDFDKNWTRHNTK